MHSIRNATAEAEGVTLFTAIPFSATKLSVGEEYLTVWLLLTLGMDVEQQARERNPLT
jgi:hypothetical protein